MKQRECNTWKLFNLNSLIAGTVIKVGKYVFRATWFPL
jgi:hypothetical protein